MPLAPGARLGPYEILAQISAGGMGEVYRARDTRLNREVSIKVSAERFSDRFEIEARAIAQLNHPHICQLYDVGPDYLVMELVEGTPLQGPLSQEKAIEYAGQILDALDAAHQKGITHRDLKPANILVTKQGIKLLDFGLAKLQISGLKESDSTLTKTLTAQGQIAGTLQYMSPEQLQSQPVDERSDLFSFGCVLYEMLTGKRAFEGQNAASLIAAILEREPAPLEVALPLDRVVGRSLAKDPDQRFQTARDLKAALAWAMEQPHAPAVSQYRRNSREVLAWALAAAVSLALTFVALIHFREKPAEAHLVRFLVQTPHNLYGDLPVVAPNGQRLVFSATDADGKNLLWLRSLDSPTIQPITGTEQGLDPFWSPDSRLIAFFSQGKLKKIDPLGGPAQVLCDVPDEIPSGAWSRDGVILFNSRGTLMRISSEGGEVKAVREPDKSQHELWLGWPLAFYRMDAIFSTTLTATLGQVGSTSARWTGKKPASLFPPTRT